MARTKLSMVLLLLLVGMVLFGERGCCVEKESQISGGKFCPLYCLADLDYMTCLATGDRKLPAKCNCCLAPKGCTLHFIDGTQIHCSS